MQSVIEAAPEAFTSWSPKQDRCDGHEGGLACASGRRWPTRLTMRGGTAPSRTRLMAYLRDAWELLRTQTLGCILVVIDHQDAMPELGPDRFAAQPIATLPVHWPAWAHTIS